VVVVVLLVVLVAEVVVVVVVLVVMVLVEKVLTVFVVVLIYSRIQVLRLSELGDFNPFDWEIHFAKYNFLLMLGKVAVYI
jgi:hypothetical protein